jgi:hypothetical protein
VDKSDDLPAKLDFERRRQRAPQRRLVDVAVDGVHDWAEGCEFFQRRDADEVTGVDHGIGPRSARRIARAGGASL